MRLIHRDRHSTRGKAPRIAISQAEITADLHYPARAQPAQAADAMARRGVAR